MSFSPSPRRVHQRAVALVIVLAFVVLLTGLIVAFFSQSLLDRQISNSSANATKVDLFAQGAVDTITGDLKQEITAGSVVATPSPSPSPANGAMLYTPYAPQSAVVCLAGSTGTAGMQNLLKRSAYNVPFYANPTPAPSATPYNPNYPASNRAANVSSTAPSLTGRYVSPARWNQPLLLPKKTLTSDADLTPVSTFTPPDWVLLSRNGTNPTATAFDPSLTYSPTSPTSVIGRYAYNIYDEGGLLDMNVAGYPSNSTPAQASYKNALAYADLTQLKDASGNPVITQPQIDQVVAWRNYASASTDWTQPTPAPGATLGTFLLPSWTAGTATNYFDAISANASGFMRAANPIVIGGPPGQTDRFFAGRQELINLLLGGIAASGTAGQANRASLQNALLLMGTFSRGLNQPSYIPAVHSNYVNAPKVLGASVGGNAAYGFDREINPNYLTVRVLKPFLRSDGSNAAVGDPFVSKRFPLQRLAWLTCKGPSALRNQNDPDIQALIQNGVTWSYLQQGTTNNIKTSFGLNWNGTQWLYNIHNNVATGKGSIMRVGRNPAIDATADATKYVQDLANPRDPDFFELLKSAITVGSLGKTLVNSNNAVSQDPGSTQAEQPLNYNYDPEASVDRQVVQIGANIIGQSRVDNLPVQIVFDDGVGNRNATNTGAGTSTVVVGVANLPYLYNVTGGVLQVRAPNLLPRNGVGSGYNGMPGTGTGGDSGYQADPTGVAPNSDAATLTDSGVGVIMQMPVIWNPHDPNSPVIAPALASGGSAAPYNPTQFRVVADSTTPDQVIAGAATSSYSQFFGYATSQPPSQPTYYSYQASSNSPNHAWYYSSSGTGSEIAAPVAAATSAIYISLTSSSLRPLFPQPTLLWRASSFTDLDGNGVSVTTDTSNRLATDPAVSGLASNGGLPSWVPSAPGTDPTLGGSAASLRYLGFYMGSFPWAWTNPAVGAAPSSAAQSGPYLARVTGALSVPAGSSKACYMTYRMQYKDPTSGSWITYDTKYGKVGDSSVPQGSIGNTPASSNPSPSLFAAGTMWGGFIDPRTSRFGMHWNENKSALEPSSDEGLSPYNLGGLSPARTMFINPASGEMASNRPDAQAGYYFLSSWSNTGNLANSVPGWMAWLGTNGNTGPGFAPGLFEQNNTDIPYVPSRFFTDTQGNLTQTPNYFADPDGIVRRAMGGFVPIGTVNSPTFYSGNQVTKTPPTDTTVGLPMATLFCAPNSAPIYPSPTIVQNVSANSFSQAQSRPYFLHRPFRSVAELGGVFSDTPWRNLDFSTPETGTAALLDVFCVNESDNSAGLIAGRINLNARQPSVVQAVLAGAYLDPATVSGNDSPTEPLNPTVAANAANALAQYIANNGPLQNIGELAGKWVSNQRIQPASVTGTYHGELSSAGNFYDGKLSYLGFSGSQWDPKAHGPLLTTPAADVYSAYMSSTSTFTANTPDKHNGTKETAAYVARFREAPVRALAAAGQTRVWNLMIDLVAQTGRYPASAKTLANFTVEGEQRYWVHLAIDRFTGQIVDKQVEIVKE